MNAEMMVHPKLNEAFQAHGEGRLQDALTAYEQHLAHDPQEPLALYGAATITLSQGDMRYYSYALEALFNGRASSLDKPLAADSITRLLLSQHYQDHARALLDDCEKHGLTLPDARGLRESVTLPAHLAATRYDPQLGLELERYRPIESVNYVYAIDIVGGCNLRCPTCPVSQQSLPKGLMELSLYKKILSKIRTEAKDANPDIWLFNWTEPLLHPEVDQFIEATHAMGMTSFLSSNLNLGERIEAVMRAKPARFKVSLSSLNQSTYGKTHARGDIAQVVANLHSLAHWRDHYKSPTEIWIGHHLYRDTFAEQQEIKALADKLGFGYAPSPAIVAPIERVMRMGVHDDVDGLRGQLLFDPLQVQQANARKRSGKKDCELRFNMTTIQHDGLVNLCCATTKSIAKEPVDFLNHSHQQLEDMKYDNAFCKQCMKANLHLTMADR